SPAVPRYTKTSSRATTSSMPACRNRSTCWSRKSARSPWTWIWSVTDESATRPLQASLARRAVRCHQDRHRVARENPFVVLRRSPQARNHQLSYVQARARRFVLLEDLRADQRL